MSREPDRPDRPVWLFVDGSGTYGGHQVMLLRWLQELYAQNDVHAVVLARVESRVLGQATAYADVAAMTNPPVAGGKRSQLWHLLKDWWVMFRTVRAVRPHLVIMAEGCLLAQARFTFMAWLLRIPALVYVPLVEPAINMGFARGRERDWLVQHVYRHLPSAWLTITEGQACQLRSWAHLMQPVFCLPNALSSNIERLRPVPIPAHHPVQVLVLGRLDAHQKSLDTLLDYLALHPELRSELCINLVGEGPYRDEIAHRLHADAALAAFVSLRPWAPTIEVMTEHDVLLLASRYEGVPLVVLEAMALGLPVVSTDLPGIRSLLPVGSRFALGDYATAIQIVRSLSGELVRTEVIKRNLQVVHAQASGDVFAKSVRNLTRQLLALCGDAQPQLQRLEDNVPVDL